MNAMLDRMDLNQRSPTSPTQPTTYNNLQHSAPPIPATSTNSMPVATDYTNSTTTTYSNSYPTSYSNLHIPLHTKKTHIQVLVPPTLILMLDTQLPTQTSYPSVVLEWLFD